MGWFSPTAETHVSLFCQSTEEDENTFMALTPEFRRPKASRDWQCRRHSWDCYASTEPDLEGLTRVEGSAVVHFIKTLQA
jgi:hypothetical protein